MGDQTGRARLCVRDEKERERNIGRKRMIEKENTEEIEKER